MKQTLKLDYALDVVEIVINEIYMKSYHSISSIRKCANTSEVHEYKIIQNDTCHKKTDTFTIILRFFDEEAIQSMKSVISIISFL